METADGTDPDVWRQASAQLGLPGIAVPEEYGGAGFSFAEQAIVLEELGAALFTGPYLASAVLAATALLASDDQETMKDLLPGIAAGETVATLAFTEDGGSWDPASIRLAATKNAATKNNGSWRLDGHKSFVLDGHAADLVLAVAATGTDGTAVTVRRHQHSRRPDPPSPAHAGPDQEAGPAGVQPHAGPAGRRARRGPGRARSHSRRGGRRARGRAARRRAARARHGRGLRQGQAAVRPADRQLPGHQAPVRRPAARGGIAALGRRLRRGRRRRGLDRSPACLPRC